MPVLRPKQSDRSGGDVVLAAGDVDVDRARLAERDHARVEPVDQRPQGQEIQLARILANRSNRSWIVRSLQWSVVSETGSRLSPALSRSMAHRSQLATFT